MPNRDVTSSTPGSHERNSSGACLATTTGSAHTHPRACSASSSERRSSSPAIAQKAETTVPGGGEKAARYWSRTASPTDAGCAAVIAGRPASSVCRRIRFSSAALSSREAPVTRLAQGEAHVHADFDLHGLAALGPRSEDPLPHGFDGRVVEPVDGIERLYHRHVAHRPVLANDRRQFHIPLNLRLHRGRRIARLD